MVESFLAVVMFPVSSNFVNTPKRYDFSKCKHQKELTFHDGSKLGLRFSREPRHEGMIGGLDVEEGGEGYRRAAVGCNSVAQNGGDGGLKVGSLEVDISAERRR